MRAFLLSLAFLSVVAAVAPGAMAGTVSGRVVDSGLLVTFRAEPGEDNNMGLATVRRYAVLNDFGAPLVPGRFCRVDPDPPSDQVFCGPAGRGGIELVAHLGDGDDGAEIGRATVYLESGDDVGVGDRVYGGPGKDRLIGFEQRSALFGGPGKDRISGGGRRDRLHGGAGDDRLDGGREGDWIVAGPGADAVTAGQGRDRVAAGAGDDVVSVADGERDVAHCGPGRDQADVDPLDVLRGCERVTFGPRD
jgi:Ca2+-binding RTX toxin-like protein